MPDSGSPPLSRLGIAAVAYAHQGWPVEPLHSAPAGRCSCGNPTCPSPGKHPRTVKGFLDASCDADVVTAWWRQWPDANIGMMPGAAGYLVIDVDGPVGAQAAMRLGLFAEPTLEVETGRPDGGRHRYYRHPPGVEIGNAKLADHLDVRADKGYVLLPPSIHPSGRTYRWHGRLDEVSELPAPITAQLTAGNGQRGNGARPDQLPAWMLPWLEVGEGGRNNTLTRFVGWAYHAGHDESTVLAMALGVNSRYHPPLEPEEVQAVVRSIGTIEGRKAALPAIAEPPPPDSPSSEALPAAVRMLDAPPPEPVEWIATGFLLRDINVLAGEGEAGKSTLALAIAGALANGSKVLGHFPTARPRVVLLVWEEDGHDLTQNRLEALIAGHRWDRDRVLGNLYLHAQHGICLDDTEWQTQIGREAADLDVDLVMVDTVGTAMKGSDMVKPETKVVTTFCRALVQGGRGVLLLAHVSKPSEQRPAKRHRLFGSVEWYNASRMAWWVDRRDTGASLECIKASRTRKPDPLTVVRRVKTDPENEAVWQSATMVLGKETSDPSAVSDLDIAVLRVLCHTLQAPTSTELRLLVRRGGGKGTNEDVQTSLAALLALNLIRWERVGKAKNWHATDEGRAIYLSLKGQPANA